MAILVAAVAAYNGGGHACGLVLNYSKTFLKKRTPQKNSATAAAILAVVGHIVVVDAA